MSGVNYSQCWEDVRQLKQALRIESDDVVLSITSGGDNSLALLAAEPRKIFMVDMNPAQNHLAELKLRATQVLDYDTYLGLLGLYPHETRGEVLTQVAPALSPAAQAWLRSHHASLTKGPIHSGKFERYLNRFRRYVLPLAHSSRTVSEFLATPDLPTQVAFYEDTWDTWRWRLAFRLATAPTLLRRFARQTGSVASDADIGRAYSTRLDRLLRRNHVRTNHYLHYALAGEYGSTLPDYLRPQSFATLRACDPERYTFRHQDLLAFLRSMPDRSLNKFNLSDAFDFMTEETAKHVWQEIVRTATPHARVAHWCNQRTVVVPEAFCDRVVPDIECAHTLMEQDRLYYYQSFHVYSICV